MENKELHEMNLNKQFIEEMELKRKKEREEFIAKMPKKDYKPIDDIEYQLQLFLTFNPKRAGDTAYNCFSMIRNIINNIYSNPNEQKFQRVKFTSQGFQNKVGQHTGPMKIFDILGFDYEDEFMVYKGKDNNLLKGAVDLLDKFISMS